MPRLSRFVVSLSILCLSSTAWADADSERSLRQHCSDAHLSSADVLGCLDKVVQNSAQSLAQAEQRMEQALQLWDEDVKYIHHARSQLAQSQKAFAHYREQQCQLFSSIGGGAAGNARKIRYLACTSELNLRRAAQLQSVLQDIPNQ